MRELFRTSIRGLRQRRGLAATVVLTLAVGIGANSAVFSAVDAVLLKPLPYPGADRLVAVYELNQGLKQATQMVAPGRLEEWHAANRSLAGLAGSYFENVTDTTGPTPLRVEAMRTSPRFFEVLGVGAALGRTLTPEEERVGGPSVVVLSDAFWRGRFNGDPAVIGQQLRLSAASRTIVGVMPPSFRYPTATTEVWIPAQTPAFLLKERRARFFNAIGRLKPGVSIEQAQDDLTAVQTELGKRYPDTDKGWGASLVALKEQQVGGVRRSIWLLFGAVALVLMAACGNVACLMLAEAARREHEVAVRVALGASRGMVVRQLLAEGLLLALAGASLGLFVAWWGTGLLRQQAVKLPRIEDVTVDLRLVLFTAAIGVSTTLLFALAPALRAAKADPGSALARGGRGHAGGGQRLQRVLVAAQVALAIVLLVGASLLIRSFAQLQHVFPGFDPDRVLTFRISASWNEAPASVVGRQARTIARLQSIPGVESAAISQAMPAGVDFPPQEFRVVGSDPANRTFADSRAVSAGYFRAMRIPMLQGDTCGKAPPTALASQVLVTKAFADRYLPRESAVGHALTSPASRTGQHYEIVGVVGDVREKGLEKAAEPLIYWCGYSGYWPDPFYVVRSADDRPASIADIRAALKELEPTRAMYAIRPLSESLSASLSQRRLSTLLLALFAATTVLLAAIGLYGVLSQLVAARRREIGVRMALGARAAQILSSVVGQAAAVVAGGIVVGLSGAFVIARFMATLLFGISAHDPLTFALVPLVLAVVAGGASLIPAARAAAVDPMRALRDD